MLKFVVDGVEGKEGGKRMGMRKREEGGKERREGGRRDKRGGWGGSTFLKAILMRDKKKSSHFFA